MVFLINPFTPSHLLPILRPCNIPLNPILYGFGVLLGVTNIEARCFLLPVSVFHCLDLPHLPFLFLSLDWVFTFLNGEPLPKLALDRNNEEKTQAAKTYGLQLAQTLCKPARGVWFVGAVSRALCLVTEWFTSRRQNPLNCTHTKVFPVAWTKIQSHVLDSPAHF